MKFEFVINLKTAKQMTEVSDQKSEVRKKISQAAAESTIVVFGAGEKLYRLIGYIELQPLHVRQVFAVDVDFDGIFLGDVEHLVDVVFGREQR